MTSKLIKLSTTVDQQRQTNSFSAISDQELIIEPNSQVALINCHISSGILKDYQIQGTDSVSGENGTIWATLSLLNQDPQPRNLLLRNGVYNITTLCQELKRSILSALCSLTSSGYAVGTDPVLPLPENSPEFELAVDVFVNGDHKIQINYNSKPLLTTGSITYGNKSDGILFNTGTGNITFDPTGASAVDAQLKSDQALGNSQDCSVIAVTDITGFSVGDTVSLIDDKDVDNPATSYSFTLNKIEPAASNLQSQIPLDTATADVTNKIIFSTTQTSTGDFKIGDVVSIDDGTSIDNPPTLSANYTFGTLSGVSLEFNNDNQALQNIPSIPLDITFSYQLSGITNPVKVAAGQWTFDILNPGAPNWINEYIAILDKNDNIVAAAQITAFAAAPVTTPPAPADTFNVGVNLVMLEGLNEDQYMSQITDGSIYTLSDFDTLIKPGLSALLPEIPQSTEFWAVNRSLNPFVFRMSINQINDNTNDSFNIVLNNPANWSINTPSGFKQELDALAVILFTYKLDWSQFELLPAYHFLTANPLGSAPPFNAGDVCIMTSGGNKINTPLPFEIDTVVLTQIGMNDYYTFKIVFSGTPTAAQEFDANKTLLSGFNFFNYEKRIFKNDNSQSIKFTFGTIDDDTKLTTATRIWKGQGVTFSNKLSLRRQGTASGFNPKNYTVIIKGQFNSNYSDRNAFCVSDQTCTPGAGRVVFQITTLPDPVSGSDFGLVELSQFQSIDYTSAPYRVKLRTNAGGILVYRLYRSSGAVTLGSGSDIPVNLGDKVCIQWNVCHSSNDKYLIAKPGDVSDIDTTPAAYVAQTPANYGSAQERELERLNVVFSVVRTNSTQYRYIGSSSTPANSGYPYTPVDDPFQTPFKWDPVKTYVPFIRPGKTGAIRILELTSNPMVTTDANGIAMPFDGTSYIFHPDYHTPDVFVSSNNNTNKYGDPATYFQINLVSDYVQKLLGFSEKTYIKQGVSGSIISNRNLYESYLPDNLLILLDDAPQLNSFDMGQTKGARRQILASCVNTNSPTGHINVEPSNPIFVSLGNNKPLNARRLTVSFEDFYGQQIILNNAKATVNLLVKS